MAWFKSDDEKHAEALQDAYERGQETGSTEGDFGVRSTFERAASMHEGEDIAEAYDAGHANGRENPSK